MGRTLIKTQLHAWLCPHAPDLLLYRGQYVFQPRDALPPLCVGLAEQPERIVVCVFNGLLHIQWLFITLCLIVCIAELVGHDAELDSRIVMQVPVPELLLYRHAAHVQHLAKAAPGRPKLSTLAHTDDVRRGTAEGGEHWVFLLQLGSWDCFLYSPMILKKK